MNEDVKEALGLKPYGTYPGFFLARKNWKSGYRDGKVVRRDCIVVVYGAPPFLRYAAWFSPNDGYCMECEYGDDPNKDDYEFIWEIPMNARHVYEAHRKLQGAFIPHSGP